MRSKFYFTNAIILLVLLIGSIASNAQGVGINETNSSPNPESILDVASTTKGALLPRMTTIQRLNLSLNFSHQGMVVYDTTTDYYYYWSGNSWKFFDSPIWSESSSGVHLSPDSLNMGIGGIPFSYNKLRVVGGDNRTGIHTSVLNETNSFVRGNEIAVTTTIDATLIGQDIFFTSAGGFGLRYGSRSVINLQNTHPHDVFGYYGRINGGSANNKKYGLYGYVTGSGDNSYGVYGRVSGANNYAIYGQNTTSTGFGGYFDGKVAITENLAIGNTDPSSSDALDIDNSSRSININSYNDYSGPKWGVYSIVSDKGTSNRYGLFTKAYTNSSGTAAGFGTYTEVIDNGPADTYALFAKTTGSPDENNWAGLFDGRVQIKGGTTATLLKDGHLMLGESNSTNLVLDNTRIIARDNGQSSDLYLNPFVGDVVIGSSGNVEDVRLNLVSDAGQDPLRVGVGGVVKFRMFSNGGMVVGSNTSTNVPTNGLYVKGNMRIDYTGTNGANYKLAVNGRILGEEVRIENSTNWPDYVFAKNYKLKTLEEVEEHINEHSHLPGIPSAEEVEAEGILVGDMQKRMMEKIEELTLYLIDMKKENNALKNRVEQLENSKQ